MTRRLALAILLGAAAVAAAQSPQSHRHSFGDAERWAHVFDDPQRDAWQKPHEVIQALSLPPQGVVADIGAGTGYFAARLANMLPKGRVYAADVEPDMVRYLAERAKREPAVWQPAQSRGVPFKMPSTWQDSQRSPACTPVSAKPVRRWSNGVALSWAHAEPASTSHAPASRRRNSTAAFT